MLMKEIYCRMYKNTSFKYINVFCILRRFLEI